MFTFAITHNDPKSRARTGSFITPHGTIQTPVFMPVGTRATVKTLSQQELTELDAEIILANTYHLYLRPGHTLIKEMGGLHRWMNWDSPILTDSGGFQVFSLAQGKRGAHTSKVKIDENGVEFTSHLDGSRHYLTPEEAMHIQADLGADIVMAFDECASAESTKPYVRSAMRRTHEWLRRCKKAHNPSQALFGIVQGGVHSDLRKESAQFVNEQDLPGNAIGGLSVGESKAEMYEMTELCTAILSPDKPRYLMGVGTPEDLLECVERGVDMFDCVHPTRMGRHGAFWTHYGRASIRNERFKTDPHPLEEGCLCAACSHYSRSYIRHLIYEKEMLGQRLISIHNLHFLLDLMRQTRQAIAEGRFSAFKDDFLAQFTSHSL